MNTPLSQEAQERLAHALKEALVLTGYHTGDAIHFHKKDPNRPDWKSTWTQAIHHLLDTLTGGFGGFGYTSGVRLPEATLLTGGYHHQNRRFFDRSVDQLACIELERLHPRLMVEAFEAGDWKVNNAHFPALMGWLTSYVVPKGSEDLLKEFHRGLLNSVYGVLHTRESTGLPLFLTKAEGSIPSRVRQLLAPYVAGWPDCVVLIDTDRLIFRNFGEFSALFEYNLRERGIDWHYMEGEPISGYFTSHVKRYQLMDRDGVVVHDRMLKYVDTPGRRTSTTGSTPIIPQGIIEAAQEIVDRRNAPEGTQDRG